MSDSDNTQNPPVSKSARTDGEWFAEPGPSDDGIVFITAKSRRGFVPIAKVEIGFSGKIEDEQRANIPMLVAAPAMYEALEHFSCSCDGSFCQAQMQAIDSESMSARCAHWRARQALPLARGEPL